MKKLSMIAMAMLVASPAVFADGAEIYSKKCASCHGADGTGATKMGKKAGARDYTDAAVQASFSDAEGVQAILEGIQKDGKQKMKGFKDKITEAEAKELMAHIRKFKK